jgi:hypothetical protein
VGHFPLGPQHSIGARSMRCSSASVCRFRYTLSFAINLAFPDLRPSRFISWRGDEGGKELLPSGGLAQDTA